MSRCTRKGISYLRLCFQIFITVAIITGLLLRLETFKVLMLLSFFIGNIFCGWFCPFGAVQDWLNKIGTKLKIKQFKIPAKINNYLVYLRYIILLCTIIFGVSFKFFAKAVYSHNNLLLGEVIIDIAFFLALFFFLLSLTQKRFFCRYLCAGGAKQGLCSLTRLFTINKKNNCINCKQCDKVCPMGIELSKAKRLSLHNCIGCFRCIESCPKKSLSYSRRNYRNVSKKLHQ